MAESYSIRRASVGDIEAMSELLRLLFCIEQDFSPNLDRQRAGLKKLIVSGAHNCALVACRCERVVGMCTAQAVISTAEGGEAALVEDLVVAPAFRGRGIGTALLVHIETWAVRRGIGRLQLQADTSNDRALAFYRLNGWIRTRLICLRKRSGISNQLTGVCHDT
ncbi:MAG: GNAT family N-acetyltransferase [Chitinivibrionales bacterium]|nr:GNAT family N-acetyltransferase [Chitinivibrionales bacterium]MBD3356688.1 GNAT family N-acetyltransferase [Chitinivibrionales bacterium]